MTAPLNSRVLILGTGIAGLSTALKLAPFCQIILVSKLHRSEGSTRYAQGGIASVWSKQDRFEDHQADTQRAGADLCHPKIVELCVKEGPLRVRELIELGVQFTPAHVSTEDPSSTPPQQPGSIPSTDITEFFDLHREGGHGHRRILHVDDLTGWEIEKNLLQQITQYPHVQILEHHVAVDLITEGKLKKNKNPGRCLGAYLLDTLSQQMITVPADVTLLATGGAGKVYLYTSNPDTCTGDGIAIAYRAGARVANLEFMQFHPTCLYHPTARTFLISEALRGEGALLKNLQGQEFMKDHHPMGSLAPRDIVARAIDCEMKRTGDKHVLLDCSSISPADLRRKFPNITHTCFSYGIDITTTPIPIVPAAHYTCGGVWVNEHAQTDIAGLYAVGEVACTGLHGANRLASNSLLEAVVFAHRAAEHALGFLNTLKNTSSTPLDSAPIPDWDVGQAVALEERLDIAAAWLEIRHCMWNYVGIVRSDRRLARAKRRLQLIQEEIETYYWDFLLTQDLIELRNILTVAQLIVEAAQSRKESRGLHYTVDYPATDNLHFKRDTLLSNSEMSSNPGNLQHFEPFKTEPSF